MGDRVYASIEFGGHIETIEELETLCEALVNEGVTGGHDDHHIRSIEDARIVLRSDIEDRHPPFFYDNEVNYGTFDQIEAAVDEIPGLGCCTTFEAGGGFSAGMKTVMPNGDKHEGAAADDDAVVSRNALIKARQSDDPLAAIDQLIEEAANIAGANLPPFTVSPQVAAYLKIFGGRAAA